MPDNKKIDPVETVTKPTLGAKVYVGVSVTLVVGALFYLVYILTWAK